MEENAIPEFGTLESGAQYVLRPSAYAIIRDDRNRIALVRTPGGVFLPGGGQDPGESLEQALVREVMEEGGLHVAVRGCIGTADELCCVRDKNVRKRSSFFEADISRSEVEIPKEKDHELFWLSPDQALLALTHESQKWALERVRC